MKKIAAIFVLVILAACSPQARLDRLVKRNPELIHQDTFTRLVSVPVPEVRADTCFIDRPGDTVTLENGRLVVDYVRIHDTVKIWGRCKADTIRVNDTVIISRVKVIQTPQGESALNSIFRKRPTWAALVLLALIGLVIVIILRFTPKRT